MHGDEGFSSSTLSCDAIGRWVADGADSDLPDDAAVLVVHAVDPWGMTFWWRQNESNVDLNRNWGRDECTEVPNNTGYHIIHPTLAPGGDEPPTPESLLDVTRALMTERGFAWVKSAVSEGRYTHPDDATSGPKHGQIASGLADVVPGDRSNPEHAQIVRDHRCGSTPDDAEWERSARAHGVAVLDTARVAVSAPAF